MKTSVLLPLFILFFAGRTAEEGMWLLDAALPLADMKKHGLELTAQQIYSDTGTSLTDAIILLPGGTGAFVSGTGLILTNHHIAFAGIQSLSTVQDDYLKNGFHARSYADELPTSYTAEIVVRMRDATSEVSSSVTSAMSTEERTKAIQTRIDELRKAAEEKSGRTVRISEMFNGVRYELFEFEVLRDVRLVYAPPEAIGVYGGEVDNWVWPRHTGDFAFMRAYVGPDGKPAAYATQNIPYSPKKFLPFSLRGISQGTFAMVMGFPGRTFRYREAESVQLAYEETLPTLIDLYKTRIDITERHGANDRAVQIRYASKIRRIENAYKNYIGTLEGMKKANFLDVKRKEEQQFAAYLSADSTGLSHSLLSDIREATDDLRSFNRKNIFLTTLGTSVELLFVASRVDAFAQRSTQAAPTEKERTAFLDGLSTTYKDFDPGVDKDLLVAMILKSADFPADQQVEAFRSVVGSATGSARERKVREYVDDLYESTRLVSREKVGELLKDGEVEDDDGIRFWRTVNAERLGVNASMARYNTAIGQLRMNYARAFLAWRHGTYPDANRTLRFSYGEVKDLAPRDAVRYAYLTTLTGIMEKETGVNPFEVPPKLKDIWQRKDFGPYADRVLGDVPVAFIATLDITGGSSGSPVMNGKGEIIGCSYDGNWEGVVGDYYYQERLNRSINVDIRYVVFILDKFSAATNILNELVLVK